MSMTATAPEQKSTPLGRFELRRVLGKGAQATVWLGFDPRLEREVAVKLMHPGSANDSAAVNQWLQEARNVSRLTHPNIVPVFEADSHGQQPYLVFEYVPGRTLAEHLRARGALPPREGVALMLGVLDALAAAHAAGVVHRDLKPSNVLVDGAGRARVMDFGIAARVKDSGRGGETHKVVGTPGYMSPEAASGLAPTPAMDVFSAGLVLAEILSGKQIIAERDPYRAIYRVAHEDLALPADLSPEVDDALRALVLRAIARNPSMRHPSVQAFRDALSQWSMPAPGASDAAAANTSTSASNGTLEFLLRRMRHKSDFPAMSDSVVRIQRVANSEKESIGSLTGEILKDVALTNKLLRMVNTVQYSHAGGGSISTVSRAVALIGFAGIRNMALSLVLLDHMHDKTHAQQLKEEFLRSLMAGSVAGELCPVARETEEVFIGAMFHNLGRLLTEYYFPEEARQIRSILTASGSRESEEAVSISVLGLSYEALGVGIAKNWGLPDGLQRCMRKMPGPPPTRPPENAQERLRWVVMAGNEITDTLLHSDPAELKDRMAAVAERYSKALGLNPKDIDAAAGQAKQKLAQLAQAMNISVAPSSAAHRLMRIDTETQAIAAAAAKEDTLSPHQLQATTLTAEDSTGVAAAVPINEQATQVLTAGIQDITNSMVENFRLNEVLRMILETMFRALGFRRIVFCLRDPKTNTLTGRFGLGEDAEAVSAAFKVPLSKGTDLFYAVCVKGADTLITDATVSNIAQRLPEWYLKRVNAPAFLLLPLQIKNTPFALIYADMAQPGGITLDEKELSLLRTLRNQAVMAFKQSM
jgi:serine/threonine protein kinase